MRCHTYYPIGNRRRRTNEADAKDYSLGEALNEGEFYAEEIRDHLFVGNRRGLDLASLSIRFRVLEEEVTSQKVEITSHKIKISSLEGRVRSLTISLDAYKLLRNRFISTFKRDKLGNTQIGGLSRWETHGCMEAMLSSIPSCVKAQAEEEISQLSRNLNIRIISEHSAILREILRLTHSSHQPTIDILNTHAGVAASYHKVGSDKFYKLFAEFVKLFKESGQGYEERPLQQLGAQLEVSLNCTSVRSSCIYQSFNVVS